MHCIQIFLERSLVWFLMIFFALDELPKRTAVVGAGYIAVELAGVLHALGSDTQLFVRENRPLRKFDKEIVETLVDVMAASGPTLHTYAIPKEVIKNDDDSLTLVLKMGKIILLMRLFGQLADELIFLDSVLKKQVLNLTTRDL